MSAQVMQICENALNLSPYERIEIIENLFFSLEKQNKRNRIDNLWAEEAENRLSAYENGNMETIAAEDVFKKINLLK